MKSQQTHNGNNLSRERAIREDESLFLPTNINSGSYPSLLQNRLTGQCGRGSKLLRKSESEPQK